jgi:hypothetical protein
MEAAVSFVEKNGILGGRESCHSPFRYLITAADDVLKVAPRQQRPLVRSATHSALDAEQANERIKAALLAFEGGLSSEQRKDFINRFVEQEFTWGYVPSKPLLTRLAADRWYSQNQSVLQRASAG